MFRPLALPALTVLLWCFARAPNAPPTYELTLDARTEDARDPGPDPDADGGLTNIERLTPELARIVKMLEQQAIEREWFDEPRPAITVPRCPLFAEWDAVESVRYGFPPPYSNRAFPLNRHAFAPAA